MKRTIAPTTLVIVFATVFVLGIVPNAQAGEDKECSNATLQGSFGFTVTGSNVDVPPFNGPFGQVGRQTFDGKGNTDGTATTSVNGTIVPVTFAGSTYAVNPDCTSSMTLIIEPVGLTGHVDFVIDDDGAEFRAIGADSGSVITAVGKKQSPRGRKE